MGKFQRILIVLCGVAVLGHAFWLWECTGRRWFTQFYRADLDPANIPSDPLDATLAAGGLYDEGGKPKPVDFQFHLGLVPSGFGKQALSVCTVGGPAFLAVIAACWPQKRGSRRG